MKNYLKIFLIFILTLSCIAMMVACESTNQRVQAALDKMKDYESVEMEGNIDATVDISSMGQSTDMESKFNVKVVGEDISMVMENKTDIMDMTIEMYMVGDKYYMRIPELIDQYIDLSDMKELMNKEAANLDLTVFDFDVDATELEAEDTKIKLEGEDIDVLKVRVLLEEDQLTDIIKELFAQQNFSSDTLAGQGLEQAADIYESIKIDSAEYTLYVDNDNNIVRYDIDAIFNMEMMGQEVSYDMEMIYNVIDTGESVVIELPEINEENTMKMEDLLG